MGRFINPVDMDVDDFLKQAPPYAHFIHTREEQYSPRYSKTFSHEEIERHAHESRNAYLISEDNAPFMEYVANETYKVLNKPFPMMDNERMWWRF